MSDQLLQKLKNKTISKQELFDKVEQDFSLLPEIMLGLDSSNPTIRYGCSKTLMDLSKRYPEKLYPHIRFFIVLLDSKYRVLTWNAMAIIAYLAKVDVDKKFGAIFEKYYSFLNNEYLVTVANVVGNSDKIALAKPYLIDDITGKLLSVEEIKISPHLTEECKRVIVEKTIMFFNMFFGRVQDKNRVVSFVNRYVDSKSPSLRREAESFINKWVKPS